MGHNLKLFDFLNLCKSTGRSEYFLFFLSTVISHLSSTNMSLCFIITVYMFFFIYTKKMEVEYDMTTCPVGIATSEGHVVT